MQSYKSITGKIFNQAPYDPKLYKYINVPKVTFDRSKPKKQEISQNVETVQGKIFNQAPYNPKLNRFNITPQNYKQQLEKVKADIAIKNDLTSRVNEANTGERMEAERRRKNYAPILEQIASTGIVISKTITNPRDVVDMLKSTIDDTKKNTPKSEWHKAIPEAIKAVALALVDKVRAGEIDPARVPDIIDAVESDADLSREDPFGGEEVFVEDAFIDEAGPEGEDAFATLRDLVWNYIEPRNIFDVIREDDFRNRYMEGMNLMRADPDYDTIHRTLSSEAIRAALFAIISEIAPDSPLDDTTRLSWLRRAIYGEESLPDIRETDLYKLSSEFLAGLFDGATTYKEYNDRLIEAINGFDVAANADILTKYNAEESMRIITLALVDEARNNTTLDMKTKIGWIRRSQGAENIPEMTGPEVAEPSIEELIFDPNPREVRDYEEIVDDGKAMIAASNASTDFIELYDDIFGTRDDTIMSELTFIKASSTDKADAREELEDLLKERMTELGIDKAIFYELGLARVEPASESVPPGGMRYATVTIDADGNIYKEGIPDPIGKYNPKTNKAIFIDATGDETTYNLTKDELIDQFTNGGEVMSAMLASKSGVLSDYKRIDLKGMSLPGIYTISGLGRRGATLSIIGGPSYSIESRGDTTKLTKLTRVGPNEYEAEIDAKNIVIPRKLFTAWVLLTSDNAERRDVEALKNLIGEYARPHYNYAYRNFKDFLGGKVIAFSEDIIGFGTKKSKAKLSPDGSIVQRGNMFYDASTNALKAILLPSKQLKVTISIGDPKVDGKVAVIPDKINPKDIAAIFSATPVNKRKKLTQLQEDILTLIQVSNLEKHDKYASTPVTHSKNPQGPPSEITPEVFNEIVSQLDKHLNGGAISKQQYLKVMRGLEHA